MALAMLNGARKLLSVVTSKNGRTFTATQIVFNIRYPIIFVAVLDFKTRTAFYVTLDLVQHVEIQKHILSCSTWEVLAVGSRSAFPELAGLDTGDTRHVYS